jgi:hypothetical protein
MSISSSWLRCTAKAGTSSGPPAAWASRSSAARARRLDDQVVEARRRLRFSDELAAAGPQIAGEQKFHRAVVSIDVHSDGTGPQDMAGGPPGRPDISGDDGGFAELHRPELGHQLLGVARRVDGFDQRPAPTLVATIEVADLGFLDAAGVGQHDLAKVAGGGGSVDRPGVAGPHELGQQAGMVDVRVG